MQTWEHLEEKRACVYGACKPRPKPVPAAPAAPPAVPHRRPHAIPEPPPKPLRAAPPEAARKKGTPGAAKKGTKIPKQAPKTLVKVGRVSKGAASKSDHRKSNDTRGVCNLFHVVSLFEVGTAGPVL